MLALDKSEKEKGDRSEGMIRKKKHLAKSTL
jgi:hypothetical protein